MKGQRHDSSTLRPHSGAVRGTSHGPCGGSLRARQHPRAVCGHGGGHRPGPAGLLAVCRGPAVCGSLACREWTCGPSDGGAGAAHPAGRACGGRCAVVGGGACACADLAGHRPCDAFPVLRYAGGRPCSARTCDGAPVAGRERRFRGWHGHSCTLVGRLRHSRAVAGGCGGALGGVVPADEAHDPDRVAGDTDRVPPASSDAGERGAGGGGWSWGRDGDGRGAADRCRAAYRAGAIRARVILQHGRCEFPSALRSREAAGQRWPWHRCLRVCSPWDNVAGVVADRGRLSLSSVERAARGQAW